MFHDGALVKTFGCCSPRTTGHGHGLPRAAMNSRGEAGRRKKAHGFTIAAIEGEGDPDFLAVVTADLEAVGAPAAVSLIHRDAAVVTALGATAVPIEQQAMDLHDPIDSFVVRRLTPLCQGPPLED